MKKTFFTRPFFSCSYLFALLLLQTLTVQNLKASSKVQIADPVFSISDELNSYSGFTVLINKAGDHDWTFVLQDSDGNIIDLRNNVNETDTLVGLKKGVYTIWELNPMGAGRVYSFKINASTAKHKYVSFEKENDFDFVHEAVDLLTEF